MKTINQLVITVGILLCSLAVWADDAAEKASLETYFSSRGTNYIDVIALADENQALRDSVNTLYKNSFAVIDTVGGEYIFQGFFTLDGQKPELPKVDTLYVSPDAAAYLGEDGIGELRYHFNKGRDYIKDETFKCSGEKAPMRMLTNAKPVVPIFGDLPCRVEGINYAISGGMTYVVQKLMRGDDIDRTKCMLNSDVYFKVTANLMGAFLGTDIYKAAKKKPLIYEVPLAKAKRLEFLSRDTLDYLHFVGLNGEDTVRLNKWAAAAGDLANLTATFEYSKDRKTWKDYTWEGNGKTGTAIPLESASDTVFFRAKGENGKNATMSLNGIVYYKFVFGADDSIAAGGNVMSLYDAKCEQDTMTKFGFYKLFSEASQLVSAPKLPATKLAANCYGSMFDFDTLMTEAPELKATALATNCYQYMFAGCSALTTAPALPADTLAEGCYFGMFQECYALTQIPELKATILAKKCYSHMFAFCSALEINTCEDGICSGVKFDPTTIGDEPAKWNDAMFDLCHEYATIQLGGHYCVGEWQGPHAVTITSIDSTRAYDGTKLVADSVIITGGLDRSKIQFELFASQTEVGSCQNTFEYILDGNADDYVIDTVYGTLKVDYISTTPVTITIAALEKTYDATPLEAEYGFTGVVETDSVVLKLDTTTLTDAGIIAVKALDCKIMRGDKNVTNGYIVKPVQPGSLKINKREVTLTSADSTKLYDSKPLTIDVVTVGGDEFAEGEGAEYTVTGSQTKAGESANTFEYVLNSNTKATNYTITATEGKLTVNAREITLTSGSAEKKYDTTPLTNSEVVMTGDGWVDGETPSIQATGSQTDAGESVNTIEYTFAEGVSADNYVITPKEGTLKVNKIKLTLTSASDEKPFDGKALTNDEVVVSGDNWATGEGATYKVTGKQTKVGRCVNAFTYTLNEGTKAGNYDITKVEGELLVTASIFPEIVGMYDKWNIMLDVNGLVDTLAQVGIEATLDPDNVSWYVVKGDVDEIDPATGVVTDDVPAVPFSGFFHTEDKAMNGQYYAVVVVPEAVEAMGYGIFQTNVVFVDTPAPTASIRKEVRDGQLIIVKDGQMYNALGGKL